MDKCRHQKKLAQQRRQEGFPSSVASVSAELQWLKADDGRCYPLGSSGPCPPSSVFSYDVFKMKTVCSKDLELSSSQLLEQDINDLDESYNQLYPEYDFYRVTLFYGKQRKYLMKNRMLTPQFAAKPIVISKTIEKLEPFTSPIKSNERQDIITSGVFQVPGSLPSDEILNGCRPGGKNGNNFKCTNPTM